ncbi:protein big brother-like isoform X4 [Argiope bruennichi]|uniref:protein big brother-like isoform X4 n=1 Tax=Argiope bruennichi TaxID=94029 RepID=UPI002494C250|nr:protein big brother-like isoform X4 [Argiope bruennichi]
MLPFETTNLFEQLPRFVFKMPRVVADQESKFQSDELFRRLSRETEVRYTGYRDRPVEERQMRFQTACREGHTEVSFIATGTNLQLMFSPCSNGYSEGCDFNKEQGKVHIKSCFIMNGVCVRWRGWLDIERLDGVGCLEYDEERAQSISLSDRGRYPARAAGEVQPASKRLRGETEALSVSTRQTRGGRSGGSEKTE